MTVLRFLSRLRKRRKAAARRDPEGYAEALMAGWVALPDTERPVEAAPAQRAEQDDAVLERYYRSQQ